MPDVTITNVPEGAEAKVKELAAVAVERFLREQDLKVEEKVVTSFEEKVDSFLAANEMEPKFTKPEEEPLDENVLLKEEVIEETIIK